MADVNGKTGKAGESAPSPALEEAAVRVLENLGELEPQLVSAGIFDRERNPVATTSGSNRWSAEAVELLTALEAGSGAEEFDSAHITSAAGEVFAVSEAGLSLIAVTGRFVLASLTSYDMRMALRDAARSATGGNAETSSSQAEKPGSEDA